MNYITDPMGIEVRSMEIISQYLKEYNLDDEAARVYSRIIHASGDPGYASIIKLHPEFLKAAKAAISSGCDIYTDVEMVRTGINKRRVSAFGGDVHCLIAAADVAAEAKAAGITRSMAAIRQFGTRLNGSIVAIGNAPTALFALIELMKESNVRPAAIVGVPVGFVGAAESKELLIQQSPVPYITVQGTKGGSPIAASIINAVMYIINNARE